MPHQSIVVHAVRSPLAQLKHDQFGPAQAWPGLLSTVPGLAQPVNRVRAWTVTPVHVLARLSKELASRPKAARLSQQP